MSGVCEEVSGKSKAQAENKGHRFTFKPPELLFESEKTEQGEVVKIRDAGKNQKQRQ